MKVYVNIKYNKLYMKQLFFFRPKISLTGRNQIIQSLSSFVGILPTRGLSTYYICSFLQMIKPFVFTYMIFDFISIILMLKASLEK